MEDIPLLFAHLDGIHTWERKKRRLRGVGNRTRTTSTDYLHLSLEGNSNHREAVKAHMTTIYRRERSSFYD